jgi:hypothetical protein
VIGEPPECAGDTINEEAHRCTIEQLWQKHPSLLAVLFPSLLLAVAVVFAKHAAGENYAPDEIINVPSNLNLGNDVETGVNHDLTEVVGVATECVESVRDQTPLNLKCKILLPVSPKHQDHTHAV